MSGATWLRDERTTLATEQILDAAGALFAERGVAAVGMAEVAAAAGCSRATLYRYFENREALRTAFVHREARRIGAEVVREVAGIDEPGERLVATVTTSLRLVRSEPTLMAWFEAAEAGATVRLAQSSEVIEALVEPLLLAEGAAAEGDVGTDLRRRARWVVRVIVSLLTVPGADPAEEQAMVEDFVVPVVLAG